MLTFLKRYIRIYSVIRRLLSKEKKRKFRIDMKNSLYSIRKGFLPESYVIYDFSKNASSLYLSDYDRLLKASKINGVNSILLDQKLLFSYFLRSEKRIIHPRFIIADDSFLDFQHGGKIETSKLDAIIENGKYVLKPSNGGGGAGILFLLYEDGIWSDNERIYTNLDLFKIQRKLKTDFLIYDHLNQTGFAENINSASLNTIRVLTMIDPHSRIPFIAATVFRTGVKKSGAVDNWSSGGISIFVDKDTGTMGKGATFPINGKLEWLSEHPDTHFIFENKKIPNWNDIKSEILKLAQFIYFVPYIAWDIVPLKSSFLILEANSNSDVNLLQVHKPLLEEGRIQEFYKFHQVI